MRIGSKRLGFAFVLLTWAGASWAGNVSGTVADYNAAKVRLANGVLVVPAGDAIYTATSTISLGSSFTVTLPSGFQFATAPTLTSSAATFTMAGGGIGSQSATFTVATSNVSAAQTIALGTYTVSGATALETITPIAGALPLTMQAIGTDPSPVPFREFASDTGITAQLVGGNQTIDLNPPSNGTEFGLSPSFYLTAVLAAIAIAPETVDFATRTVPILGANGQTNALNPGDTVTVVIPGTYGGLASFFLSNYSSCPISASAGTVSSGGIAAPNVPIGAETFFCVTGSGAPIELLPSGAGSSQNAYGFANIALSPGSSTDFLATSNVSIAYPGSICYTNNGSSCVVPSFFVAAPVPALSFWGMGALAGMLLLFGARMLRTKQAA